MIQLPSPEQKLAHPAFEQAGVELWIKRDDLIHPEISGNKWRKLAPVMEEIKNRGITNVTSYGGAWSNHLLALAAASAIFGMESSGIVRGEQVSNQLLDRCMEWGMQLRFMSREEYRKRRNTNDSLLWPGDSCIIPEGANCEEGRSGMAGLWQELQQHYTWLIDSVGSGTSVRGLASSAPAGTQVLAVMAVKDHALAHFLKSSGITVFEEYTFGGFAKINRRLIEQSKVFEKEFGIRLDPVYTAKLWVATLDLLQKGFFKRGDKLLFVHSGGLAGWSSGIGT